MVNLSYTVPMQNSHAIEDLLGPLPRPRGSATRLPELHDVVGRGLPASVILRIERKLQLSTAEIVRILEISASTRKRFNRTPRKRLDPALSDRIVRLASTVAEASDLLGDRQKAVEWFKTPIAALGDRRPMDLITSDPGARLVRDELGRIRYGHWA